MPVGINFNNNSMNSFLIKPKLSEEKAIVKLTGATTKELKSSSMTSSKIVGIAQGNIAPPLSKENLLNLQEIHGNITTPSNPLNTGKVSFQKEVDFNDIPRLSWLIGRDDNLYHDYVARLSRGAQIMDSFSELVVKTKDDQFISYKDTVFLHYVIIGFQNGLKKGQEAKTATNDPIVHKVIDYVLPKSMERLRLLQEYASTKQLGSEELPKNLSLDNILKSNPVTQDQVSKSPINKKVNLGDDYVERLLKFLTKNLKWYEWYLKNEEVSYNSCLMVL